MPLTNHASLVAPRLKRFGKSHARSAQVAGITGKLATIVHHVANACLVSI